MLSMSTFNWRPHSLTSSFGSTTPFSEINSTEAISEAETSETQTTGSLVTSAVGSKHRQTERSDAASSVSMLPQEFKLNKMTSEDPRKRLGSTNR